MMSASPPSSPIPVDSPAADRVIDAAGLVLAPGFIDMHAHSDLQILLDPVHPSRITQGVTTEVLGQDGLSYAPVTSEVLAVVRRKIAGWNTGPIDFDFDWRSVASIWTVSIAGIATNVAYLIPHGVVRALVVGWDDIPATADDRSRRCRPSWPRP